MVKGFNKDGRDQDGGGSGFPLTMVNYRLMLVGVLVIVVGFLLMSGGGSDDPMVFDRGMFSFRRITLAPVVVLCGFVFEIFAIMYRPKKEK